MKFYFNKIKIPLIIVSLSFFIVLTDTGCATQNRHKKIKSVPCPCETQHKLTR